MPNGRRNVYDGWTYEDPFFETIIDVDGPDSEEVHSIIKGLFLANPALIQASAQQLAVEVAVQRATSRTLMAVGNISRAGLRALLELLVRNLPLYAFANALSRMKQHDRDLATDRRTAAAIREWRRDHPPTGNVDARNETLIRSFWTNHATNANTQIAQANALRSRHPRILRSAPVLQLCTKTAKGECEEVTQGIIDGLFPTVK